MDGLFSNLHCELRLSNRREGTNFAPPINGNIGPRLGFAYQMFPNTAVSGGAGILFDTITARSQWVQNNIQAPTWPWTTEISNQQVNFSQNGVWEGGAGNSTHITR